MFHLIFWFLGLETITVCENNALSLACPAGTVIKVVSTLYGRTDSTTCPGPIQTTSCQLSSSLSTIQTKLVQIFFKLLNHNTLPYIIVDVTIIQNASLLLEHQFLANKIHAQVPENI